MATVKKPCPLLNIDGYKPNTIDLTENDAAEKYWFACLRTSVEKFANDAIDYQQPEDATALDRAIKFRRNALHRLETLEHCKRVGLFEMFDVVFAELRAADFHDPWGPQKHAEIECAKKVFEVRLAELDAITDPQERWLNLVSGVLAGNMHDWGAQAVNKLKELDKDFDFEAARLKVQHRPWLMDNFDAWLERTEKHPPHQCAAIFVDNSGYDLILGIIPFVRELLARGTKVLICANQIPCINDVTHDELRSILQTDLKDKCPVLDGALEDGRLQVWSTGQTGPCMDFLQLDASLCDAIVENKTDLIVIEGMGRAVHTNLYAKFTCEALKLAVIKNQWLANYFEGQLFSVICRYETPASTAENNTSKPC